MFELNQLEIPFILLKNYIYTSIVYYTEHVFIEFLGFSVKDHKLTAPKL